MSHEDIIVGYHASASRTAKRTLVSTEMDAYELPKLMPTTVGTAETSIGASAEPLGCGAIVEDSEETVGDNELDLERGDRKQILPGWALAPSRASRVYLARRMRALVRRVSSSTTRDRPRAVRPVADRPAELDGNYFS